MFVLCSMGALPRSGDWVCYNGGMSDRIRILRHEAVPQCGSFEVRFPDGRPSAYFYWDDLPSRRLRPETLDRETALERAKALARAEQDKGQ